MCRVFAEGGDDGHNHVIKAPPQSFTHIVVASHHLGFFDLRGPFFLAFDCNTKQKKSWTPPCLPLNLVQFRKQASIYTSGSPLFKVLIGNFCFFVLLCLQPFYLPPAI